MNLKELSELEIDLSQSQLQPIAGGIVMVEELVGTRLPETYVTFLLYCNGGQPKLNTFYSEFEGNEQSFVIAKFLHLTSNDKDRQNRDDKDDIVWWYQHLWANAPTPLLPFARSQDDGLFLLDLSEIGRGKVVYWARDLDPDLDLATIADSFEQLIDGLT